MTRNLPSLFCKLADDVIRRLTDFAACERGEAREVRRGRRSVGASPPLGKPDTPWGVAASRK
jgi:hypothetical protein